MIKKFLCTFSLLAFSSWAFANSYTLAYWGNWHVWDADKNGRSDDVYQMPGSINKQTRAIVINPELQQQARHLTAIAYAFLEVYPDAGMWREVPQKPVKPAEIGKIYWSDPWTDLLNEPATLAFCKGNYTTCFFAYEVEKDAQNPRPAVDPNQPYNYFYMGNFTAFSKLPNVKHIISIGGWFHQDSFEKGAFINPDNFVQSLLTLIKYTQGQGGKIDGIDLDYEPPTGYTRENATKLVALAKKIRTSLNDAKLTNITLSAAVFADPEKISAFGADNWRSFAKELNYIGIMGYDFHGAWDRPAITGLQSNLYQDQGNPNTNDFSVEKAVQALEQAGVPKNKLLLGLPSYGRVVGGVTEGSTHGLYQPYDPHKPVQADLDKNQVSYYKIVKDWLGKDFKEYQISKNNNVNGVWAYNKNNKEFVSYDNKALTHSKINYVNLNGLGGMMMWELISDVPVDDASNASLVKQMHDELTH